MDSHSQGGILAFVRYAYFIAGSSGSLDFFRFGNSDYRDQFGDHFGLESTRLGDAIDFSPASSATISLCVICNPSRGTDRLRYEDKDCWGNSDNFNFLFLFNFKVLGFFGNSANYLGIWIKRLYCF